MIFVNDKIVNEFALKRNDFNGDALSNMDGRFFHIFVIALLVECEKNGRLRLTEHSR